MQDLTKKEKILIVDDDPKIGELLSAFLDKFNYITYVAKDSKQLDFILQSQDIGIILLDIMLPEVDGLTICKNLRTTSNIPIIIISSLDSNSDLVIGLELGADDYIPKPFDTRELLARIKALLRRSKNNFDINKLAVTQLPLIYFDQWILDRNTHNLINDENIYIPLSNLEFKLLITFLENVNCILSRDQLSEYLYNNQIEFYDRNIDVLIGRLRKKIEVNSKKPELIKTSHGAGYQLVTQVKYEK